MKKSDLENQVFKLKRDIEVYKEQEKQNKAYQEKLRNDIDLHIKINTDYVMQLENRCEELRTCRLANDMLQEQLAETRQENNEHIERIVKLYNNYDALCGRVKNYKTAYEILLETVTQNELS
jgi:hypothetical protein